MDGEKSLEVVREGSDVKFWLWGRGQFGGVVMRRRHQEASF